MKKLLALLAVFTLSCSPVAAEVLGLDWKLSHSYNVTDKLGNTDLQVGKTLTMGGIELTADLDYDVDAQLFGGSDYKMTWSSPTVAGLEAWVSTGLDIDWKSEDIMAGFSLEF